MHVRPSIAPTNKCLLSGDRTRLRRTAHLRNEWRSRVVRRGFERTKRSAGRNTTNVDCPLTYFNHCWNTLPSLHIRPSLSRKPNRAPRLIKGRDMNALRRSSNTSQGEQCARDAIRKRHSTVTGGKGAESKLSVAALLLRTCETI